jgi:carboxyl-terminal processing protease
LKEFIMRKFKIIVVVISCILCVANRIAKPNLPSEKVLAEEKFNPAECFDKVWQIINKEFWDPNFNGVDWEDAGKRYRPKALAAKNHEAFTVIINQMLAELKTSHTRYFTKWEPEYYTLQAALISGRMATYGTSDTSVVEKYAPKRYSSQANPHRTGIGVVTKKIDGCHYVIAVLASSPAEKANIVLGDWLVEANNQAFHPIRSFENKAGQEVDLIIQRGSSISARHLVKVIPVDRDERELFENDSIFRTKIIEHKDRRFAYIRLCWLSGWTMRDVLNRSFGLACRSEGIIIDIRDGFGGGPAIEYIDPFLRNGLEMIVEKQIERNRLLTCKVAFNGPVIVLINGGSRSGKELLAYYFKKTGRGVLLGERTAGYVSAGRWRRISEESLLYYCAGKLLIDGKHLEGIGIEPDIEVPFDIRFAAGKDIQLERAKDEMVKLIEALP